jgi:HD-like signal output (HDOD) protein
MDLQDTTIEINPPNFRDAIQQEEDFFIQFSVFNKEAESHFHKIVRSFLAYYDLLYLRDVVFAITKELITNAVKANAKRLYFENRNLDIRSGSDYKSGMASFKSEVLRDNSPTIQLLPGSDLRVKVGFAVRSGKMRIDIFNNIGIVPEELSKIREKIKIAYRCIDISEAMSESIDDIEGAGLGLVMAIMVYKNAGFPAEDFSITSDGKSTVSSISLYKRSENPELQVRLADEITREIEALPSLPEHIRKLEKMCSDPDISIQELADTIKQDVALTSSILKLSNSAGYITKRRTETIEDAVMIIGIKGIKTLLLASGVNQIMESRYRQYREIWTDSYKRAFYAQMINAQVSSHSSTENAYLGALLSEIGRIVLLSVKKETLDAISGIVGSRSASTTDIIEEMALGVSHSTLGGIIARKWQFSESLVKTIEFYLKPYMVPDPYRDTAYIVHLAHIFTEIERKKYRFEIIDDEVLDYFHLSDKQTFERLHDILRQAYSRKLSV